MLQTKNHKVVPFTFIRKRIYYFSKRVPADLIHHYRYPRIVQSLRTLKWSYFSEQVCGWVKVKWSYFSEQVCGWVKVYRVWLSCRFHHFFSVKVCLVRCSFIKSRVGAVCVVECDPLTNDTFGHKTIG